jgi:hypothetical protein
LAYLASASFSDAVLFSAATIAANVPASCPCSISSDDSFSFAFIAAYASLFLLPSVLSFSSNAA